MKSNRYLMLVQNQYSHEKHCIELFNAACDPDRYVFDNPEMPEDMKFGTYDYRLVRCAFDNWEIVWRPDLNDCSIRIFDALGGVLGTYAVKDLRAESGMLEYRPDGPLNVNTVMESEGGLWIYSDSAQAE